MIAEPLLSRLKDVRKVGTNRWVARCPTHESKSGKSLMISIAENGRLLVCDHGGCSAQAIVAALGLTMSDLYPRRKPGAQHARPRAAAPRTPATVPAGPDPAQHLTLAANWLAFWRSLEPIIAAVGLSYLRARGCAVPPRDGHLRYAKALRHPSGYVGPALVALVTDALTGAPMTLHRTWIRADGTKADVDPPRMLLGKHRKSNGVIRLWPDDSVTTGLAITEGIETALSVATVFTPVWSLIDAGNLAAFQVLEGIESLLIVADHDPAGLRAAEQCAERWDRAGRSVRIAIPPEGMDANDLARAA